jgi:hypothetical protein
MPFDLFDSTDSGNAVNYPEAFTRGFVDVRFWVDSDVPFERICLELFMMATVPLVGELVTIHEYRYVVCSRAWDFGEHCPVVNLGLTSIGPAVT